MLLFCKVDDGRKIVIPENRIFNIIIYETTIIVNYDLGILSQDESGAFQHRIESARIIYNSATDADNAIRDFYKACASNKNTFYFGN